MQVGERANDFIPRLWAARQIGDLTRQMRLDGVSNGLVDQVRQLGLRYGILTEYTSYLVQEPSQIARPGTPVPLRDDQMGGARNSASQTGVGAFEQARASAKLADSKSLAAAESAVSEHVVEAAVFEHQHDDRVDRVEAVVGTRLACRPLR